MRRIAWWYAAGAIAVCAAIIAIYAGGGKGGTQTFGPSSLAGSPAQSFQGRSLRGTPLSLAQFRGRVVVMNLWASWCPPCRAEMPDLQRLSLAYAKRDVVVLGVNQGESADRARAFASSLGIHFPIIVDEQQQYGRVYAALGLPTTILIDRSGKVVRGFDGALTYDQMVSALQPLLRKQ